MRRRPFRDPHHSATLPALIGGRHPRKTGEISLAHNGVLFLDELPEFQRGSLRPYANRLKQDAPSLQRANHHVAYPARVQLIAAMNPCRLRTSGRPRLKLRSRPEMRADYQARLSGPLLDRIELSRRSPAVSAADLSLPPPAEDSALRCRPHCASSRRPNRALCGADERQRQNDSNDAEADGELLELQPQWNKAPAPC